MKCCTAIKTLLIGLEFASLSLSDCMQSTDMVHYHRRAGSNRRLILGAASQNTPIMVDMGASMVSDMPEQDVPVVLHVNDPVQATLMQIVDFAKTGKTDLSELVSKDVLLEAMKQKPRLWGTHLKCLYVGRGYHEGGRDIFFAKGLCEYYKDGFKWNPTSEEAISFLGEFLRSSEITKFEYPANVREVRSDYIYSSMLKDTYRVMIEFCIDDRSKSGKDLFFPRDWQDHRVLLILDHEALAKVCMLHLSGDVDINEHGQTLVCLGHAGQQIGMVNEMKRQNVQLVAQKEDVERQLDEMKERESRLNVQIQELNDNVMTLDARNAETEGVNSRLQEQVRTLQAQLNEKDRQYSSREQIMFSQLSEFIDTMIDGVKFSDSWVSDLFRSSFRRVQFCDGHGVIVTDGKNGIAIQSLAMLAKQAREADRRQMSINGQRQSCQAGSVGGCYGPCATSQHMLGESSQQYHSVAAQSQQYSMSVQPQYGRGAFMQQQPQHSQDITMSIPRQGGALQGANYHAYQQQPYNSVSVQPQQYGMSAQTQQSHGTFMQQQPQHLQGVTMSVPRSGNAPHGMNHFVPQQSYGQQ